MTGHSIDEKLKKKLIQFLPQFVNEKDRTAVILVAAKLDYLLAQAIAAKFLPCTSSNDELLDNDRALGTFSARIHAAYRLGIIDDSFAKALHIFRRLRNDFAHSFHDMQFSDGSHRDRLHELVRPLIGSDFYASVRKIVEKGPDSTEERTNFIIASAFLIGALELVPDIVVSVSDSSAVSYAKVVHNWVARPDLVNRQVSTHVTKVYDQFYPLWRASKDSKKGFEQNGDQRRN